MNLLTVFSLFPDQEACIEHLEKVRWCGVPTCPHCENPRVERRMDGDRIGRWNCHNCKSSFNVLSGTILSKTKVPLQKWFMAIGLMVNAKKSLSSYQLARDLELTHQTALFMQERIRSEMTSKHGARMLHGIIEADETYVGGKPRKRHRNDKTQHPRDRGTSKTPVIGAVERGGRVVAQVAKDLTGKGVLKFIKGTVDPAGSHLITDEYRAYNAVEKFVSRSVIDHSQTYAEGGIHTNTIEGVWSLLKRAWYGSHHHYSKRYMPLYAAKACFKYNHRKSNHAFENFLVGCFS